METLIGILLYIGAISTNTPYTVSQIHDIESQNQAQISQINQDPILLQNANNLYNDEGENVLVWEELYW